MYVVISLVLSHSFIAYMFFPIQFSPILNLPRGKGTSETRLLPGKETCCWFPGKGAQLWAPASTEPLSTVLTQPWALAKVELQE